MDAVNITEFGGPNVLTITTLPDLDPSAGDLRIAVDAVSVGFQDVMLRNGSLASFGVKPGVIPGGEVAGVVDAVGDGVDAAWLGRRVWAFTGRGGGYASQALAPATEVVEIPDGLTSTDAVAVGSAGVVAYFALDHARFAKGESILVRGAGGPLGVMAVQLAAARGASTIAVTASSRERGERLRKLGPTAVLDRDGGSTDEGGAGFDIIVDVVAGASAARFMAMLKPGGRMVMIGAVGGPPADLTAAMFAQFQRSLTFSTFSANLVPGSTRRAKVAELLAETASGRLQPIVADVLPLRQAAEAHARLEAGGVFGRIVLKP